MSLNVAMVLDHKEKGGHWPSVPNRANRVIMSACLSFFRSDFSSFIPFVLFNICSFSFYLFFYTSPHFHYYLFLLNYVYMFAQLLITAMLISRHTGHLIIPPIIINIVFVNFFSHDFNCEIVEYFLLQRSTRIEACNEW